MQPESKSITKMLAIASLAAGLLLAGCTKSSKYPDSKDAVNNSLTQNHLGAIHVSQDQDKGVITLSGTVASDSQKSEAETVAKHAAPNYTIADEIAVVPPDNADAAKAANSDSDVAIEDRFKADLKKHRKLNDQDISIKSRNGAVVLSGTVKTKAQKREVEHLAKHVPNVQHVVNEIEVKPGKHSSAS